MTRQGRDAAMTREHGFTLVEVVVAAGIGAAALATLLAIFGDGARRTDRASEERLALMLAQSALEGAGADGPLRAGAAWDGAAHGLAWRVEITEWAEAGGGGGARDAADPLLVQVAVRGAAGAGPVLAQLATLRLPVSRPPPTRRRDDDDGSGSAPSLPRRMR